MVPEVGTGYVGCMFVMAFVFEDKILLDCITITLHY